MIVRQAVLFVVVLVALVFVVTVSVVGADVTRSRWDYGVDVAWHIGDLPAVFPKVPGRVGDRVVSRVPLPRSVGPSSCLWI